MIIKNITKKTVLCNNKNFFRDIFSKAKGLMFSRKITDTGYIFVFDKPEKIDLHMFFVFFSIDVLFLDETKKTIEIKEAFKPFTVYFSKKRAKYIIELPEGTINKSRTHLGDILNF